MKGDVTELLAPLTGAAWWPQAISSFKRALLAAESRRPLILYNADADGFAASYFIRKIIRAELKRIPVGTRAVWNFEYDFQWLPAFLQSQECDLVICVDLPIIQEPAVLSQVKDRLSMIIYDHHVPPDALGLTGEDCLLYLNSRYLGTVSDDHPASAFSGALAADFGTFSRSELIVLAVGLDGDCALNRYPALTAALQSEFSELAIDPFDVRSAVSVYTFLLDSLFCAWPGVQLENIQADLCDLVNSRPIFRALELFSEQYSLQRAASTVRKDINQALELLSYNWSQTDADPVFCKVMPMTTFSVGKVASTLVKSGKREVIILGFPTENQVQFEMRTPESGPVNLTEILKIQRKYFRPLTSGGHPKASGALVRHEDTDAFCLSFREAFQEWKTSALQPT